LLRDFNEKVDGGHNFKQKIGNESLHEIRNNNMVIVVNVSS